MIGSPEGGCLSTESSLDSVTQAPSRVLESTIVDTIPPPAVRSRPATGMATAARLSPRTVAFVPFTVALVIGLWGLRRQETLWRDEAVTLEMARRDLTDLLYTLENVDAVHGLYYLFMHGVLAVFGDGLLALRLPSVLAMAAAASGVALIGSRLAGARAGLFAGLVFPLLPVVQRYAQEGRSYALVCALVTWSTFLLLRMVSRPSTRRWTAYAAVSLVACLFHEFAVLAVLAHGVALFRTRAWRVWSVAAGCVAVCLAPLIILSMGQSEQVGWVGGPATNELGPYIGLSIVGLLCAARVPGQLKSFAVPLLLLPTTILLVVTPFKPLYVERYVAFYAIGLALLVGAALDRVPARLGMASVAIVAAALLPVGLHLRGPDSRVDDVTAVAHAVSQSAAPGDGVLFMPARRRVWALTQPSSFGHLNDLALETAPRSSRRLYGTEVPVDRIHARMLRAQRIIAVSDLSGAPLDATATEAVKRETLRAHFEECYVRRVKGARIAVHAKPGQC